jgi:predicted ATP-grasp superfamily ATP-dependent carboligase
MSSLSSKPGPITILVHEWVTGGGLQGAPLPTSWAAEGRAMRLAVANDFASVAGRDVRVWMTLDARWPEEPGPWKTVRVDETGRGPAIIDLARSADYTVLIAPETMGVLASLAGRLEAAGARSLGCSVEAIELTGDKARLGDWLRSRAIPSPVCRVIAPAEGLPAGLSYPVVLKPIDGAGTLNTFLLSNGDDLPADALGMHRALVQPFHEGTPMSASVLVGRDGQIHLLTTGLQKIERHERRFSYHGGVIPVGCPGAEAVVKQAAGSIPGLAGFVGVDFLWDGDCGEAMIIEINPRLTTSFVGLCGLLPPGRLASAWLAAWGVEGLTQADCRELAGLLASAPPIHFDFDGHPPKIVEQEPVS